VEYPDELTHWSLDTQYLLGSDLLVVPVLDDSPDPVRTRCVIPPGGWVDLWSGETYEGPAVVHLEVPLERIPVFVRSGAVIPMWPRVVAHSGAYSEGSWTMHCWPAPAGASGVVYDGDLTHRYRLEPGGTALRCDEVVRRAGAAVAHLPGEPDRDLALVD
jgi:alpha-D-xyloside xylohydrolase